MLLRILALVIIGCAAGAIIIAAACKILRSFTQAEIGGLTSCHKDLWIIDRQGHGLTSCQSSLSLRAYCLP